MVRERAPRLVGSNEDVLRVSVTCYLNPEPHVTMTNVALGNASGDSDHDVEYDASGKLISKT